MKIGPLIGLLVGLTAVCLLVAWQGLETVVGLLGQAGWPILLVCLFAPFDQFMGAEAWRRLFPPGKRPAVLPTLAASWMGSAVNTLLPVATIGGEMAKARLISLWGYAGTDAISTMVVDKTVQALAILSWGLVGVAILAGVAPDETIVTGALVGAVLLALGIAGFVAVQLYGGFAFFARSAAKVGNAEKWNGIVDGAAGLDDAIRAIYRRPGAIAAGVLIRLGGRVILVGEVLLAAHLMGHPIGIPEAVMIKGLIGAIRGVSFAIPGGFGVQEGGYMAIGTLIGIAVDLMLAVSLASRVREMLPSIPVLLAWQVTESRALLRRGKEPGDVKH